MKWKILHLIIFFILSISIADAAPDNYKVIYTIDVKENGSAIWDVEYRTLLSTQDELNSFENYSSQLNSKYLIEFKELMERSAQEASNGTSRKMDATDFKGEATIHSTPTGKFGVVHYNFTWNNFAMIDQNISIGDAFVGGLYLSNDNTLIIHYPKDYTVQQVIPQPDKSTDELVWYGLRSFGKGEPQIILTKPSFPWITTAAAGASSSGCRTPATSGNRAHGQPQLPGGTLQPPAPGAWVVHRARHPAGCGLGGE